MIAIGVVLIVIGVVLFVGVAIVVSSVIADGFRLSVCVITVPCLTTPSPPTTNWSMSPLEIPSSSTSTPSPPICTHSTSTSQSSSPSSSTSPPSSSTVSSHPLLM